MNQTTSPVQTSQAIQSLPTIGRFFSLQQGRVGQYLSPRVLIVRHPFRSQPVDLHCFGFDQAKPAARFAQHLAYRGYPFELKRGGGWTRQPYEIHVSHKSAQKLAQTIAFWDRQAK
jgi:hypothetical protein